MFWLAVPIFTLATLFGVCVYCGADGRIFQDRILARLWGGDGLLPVAMCLFQPFQ